MLHTGLLRATQAQRSSALRNDDYRILCSLGHVMIAMPSIGEIEVNPLLLRPDEPHVVAVDARVAVAHH